MTTECPIDLSPYASSGIVNTVPINNLDYTNQDFWSMKTRLVNFIQERFGPTGTELPNTFADLVESDIAIMLIENWAFLADLLSFKMDQQINELFIDTVTEVENAFRLARLVGFQPQPPIAASAMFVATLNNSILTDITITTPVQIDISSGNNSTVMELFQADSTNKPLYNQDILIPAGQTTNQSIIGIEGRTRTESFKGTGQIAQNFELGYGPVIYGSIQLYTSGTLWSQVDYFTDSQPRKEYRVEYDSSYNAYIIFGNNVAGLIPSNNATIDVTYRVGGGTVGNIVTGYISSSLQVAVPGLQFTVPVSVTNYTAGNNGYDGDGVDDIRQKLPLYLQTQDRAVTGNDYKTLAEQFATPYNGMVGKATAILRNYGCSGNIVDLYILSSSGGDLITAANELKVALYEELNEQKMMTDYLCLKDGVVIPTDITIDVTLDSFYKKFELEMSANITQQVNAFFSLNNWDYGQTLKDTDIIKTLSSIKEINDFTIFFSTNDPNNGGSTVTANFYEIIRPDQVTISFMYN